MQVSRLEALSRVVTTVTELYVSVDSVVTGSVAVLLLRWKGSCRRSSMRRWRNYTFLNRHRAHRPYSGTSSF